MKFSEGDEVLAKHPSFDEYQKGKIMSVKGYKYKVQFETGIEHTVNSTDIRKPRQSRSGSRVRSPAKRATGTSPSRRSPRISRRSPARVTAYHEKLEEKTAKYAKVFLPRIEIPNDHVSRDTIHNTKYGNVDVDLVEDLPLQSRLKETGVVTRRSTRFSSATESIEPYHPMVMLTRNINRAVSLPSERKPQPHNFKVDTEDRGHSVPKDQDLLKLKNYEEDVEIDSEISEKRKKEISMVSEPQEWGGWFGAFVLMFLSPLIIIVPQLMCTEDQCEFGYPKISTDPESYINLNAFATYLGFFLFVSIVSMIPIGKKVDGQHNRFGRLQYRINGFLCSMLSLFVFATCIYNEFRITDLILKNYVQLSISGWILGVILSLLLFIKGGRAPVANLNIHGSTNSRIYNFWQGKEINPRIGPVDIKITIFRTAMISMIILNLTMVLKVLEEAEAYTIENLNLAVLLIALLQIIYSMDSLFFEASILTSFEIMYEGTGYMLCIGYMLYPFLPTLTTKYVLHNKPQFNYLSGIPVFFFISGYLLYRISNSQKDEFRRNPLSPALAHLDTISTIRGRKLIVSGLWGHVRHPNYLGDIIMWWSISCVCLAIDILPYYYAIVCTGLLVYRAIRDNERCKARYGLAWEQYMSRVKYKILHHIF